MIQPPPSDEVIKEFNNAFRELSKTGRPQDQLGEPFRKKLDGILAGETQKQLNNDEGLVFMVGNDKALIHSEPPMHEMRLFMSIVPAYAYEIDEWMNKKNVKIKIN